MSGKIQQKVVVVFVSLFLRTCLGQSSSFPEVVCSVMQTNSLVLSEVDQIGYVKSENYPETMPNSKSECRVTVTVCPHCKIKWTVVDLLAQNTTCDIFGQKGSCISGCNHIMLYETDAPEQTTVNVFQQQFYEPEITKTRRLFLTLCRDQQQFPVKFKFKIEVLEKLETFTLNNHLSNPAVFTSLFYPREYSNYYGGDDVYRYIFRSANSIGYLNLTFTDWNLYPESKIKVYIGIGWEYVDLHKEISGNQSRPFITIRNQLNVEFLTGKHSVGHDPYPFEPYMGFRAVVQPTFENVGYHTDCGRYYKNVWSGTFTVNDSTFCQRPGYYDCIFVVAKTKDTDGCFTDFFLRFDSIHMELDNRLTVRKGSTSQGQILHTFSGYHNRTGIMLTDRESYYIHFKGQCRNNQGIRFTAVFATYSRSPKNLWTCPSSSTFICQNPTQYLPKRYRCDGIRQCLDGSDEYDCSTTVTTIASCSWLDELKCNPALDHTYCPSQRCDGVKDCRYGEDEQDCVTDKTIPGEANHSGFAYSWGTVVPVALVCVVVAFIMCLLISMWTRMKKAQRNSAARAEELRMRHAAFANMGAHGDLRTMSDAPPTYDDAVFHPTPLPFNGYSNLGYAQDNFLQPPPYSPPIQMPDAASPSANQTTVPNPRPLSYGVQQSDVVLSRDRININVANNSQEQPHGATYGNVNSQTDRNSSMQEAIPKVSSDKSTDSQKVNRKDFVHTVKSNMSDGNLNSPSEMKADTLLDTQRSDGEIEASVITVNAANDGEGLGRRSSSRETTV